MHHLKNAGLTRACEDRGSLDRVLKFFVMNDEGTSWSVAARYRDAHGHLHTVDGAIVARLAQSLGWGDDRGRAQVFRKGHEPFVISDTSPGRYSLRAADRTILSGETSGAIVLPAGLGSDVYTLACDSAGARNTMTILVAPQNAYQPRVLQDGGKVWLLMAQLYAMRSARNWGHGDFTDLHQLLRTAADAGAAGVGVNPLHALAPGQASPYSPCSRLFLNPLYIDIEAIPEFPGQYACGLAEDIARLRHADFIDYHGVHAVKRKALAAAFAQFSRMAAPDRRLRFDTFRTSLADCLPSYCAYQVLADRQGRPWQKWGARISASTASRALESGGAEELALHAFIQWIAHEQLMECRDIARELGLPIGLYLDIAVGVDAGGSDAWASPDMFPQGLSIGAPPDLYNPAGQNWGLAPLHPDNLIKSGFSALSQMLRSAMRYAGAVRIDHVLGLNRLFLIPTEAPSGTYVQYPFEAMLAVVARESVAAQCLVIGEDLGTVPEGVTEALHNWGIWSYRVVMFERDGSTLYRDPDHYPAQAVVTFNTHDLATFSGWRTSHDLRLKQGLGIDPGESEDERESARTALSNTLAHHGIDRDLSFANVLRLLARSRSQILAISIDDVLGLNDQPNVPGTIAQHPNWRRRLPVDLNHPDFADALRNISAVMAAEGRSTAR